MQSLRCRHFYTRVPAIITDIDGVLIRGKTQIPGARDVIQKLKQPLSCINSQNWNKEDTNALPSPSFVQKALSKLQNLDNKHIPFLCLTNGGGTFEQEKADSVNSIVGLDKSSEFTKDDIITCHTPLKQLVPKYENEFVLISGFGNVIDVSHSYGFSKAIHIHEYNALFPQLVPSFAKL